MSGDLPTEFKARLVQTCHEYCDDKGYASMVAVMDGGVSQYPEGYAKDGLVMFDLGRAAVRSLEFTDNWVSFEAMFGGKPRLVSLHVDEIAWVGSPSADCMLGFVPKEVPSDESATEEMLQQGSEDAIAKERRENLKLI